MNPLDGEPSQTGIVSTVDTPGTAVDVAAFNDMVIVANVDGGVSVFNVFNRMNPVAIAQIDTPGRASRVALSGNWVAVVDDFAGLAIIDISDPPGSRIIFQISSAVLGGTPTSVATRGGIAYVGVGAGNLATVNMETGTVLDFIDVDEAKKEKIRDLFVTGDHLYILTDSELKIFFLSPLVTGPAVDSAESPFDARIGPNIRLFVGGNVAYAVHARGINTFDVSTPETIQPIKITHSAQLGWRHVVLNGSGHGIAALGANRFLDGRIDVSLYNFRDPADTENFISSFPTPGRARALSIFNGLVYVADHGKGLQVINYLGNNNDNAPPSVSLTASFPLITSDEGLISGIAEEGKLVRMTALVNDDVQVRNVEFNLDGNKVATDGNFPFEFFFTIPRQIDQRSFRLSVRASDTIGNATITDEIVITLVEDATPPRIIRVTPSQGSLLGNLRSISAFFSEPIDASSLTLESFVLVEVGEDGIFDTSDDRSIQDGTIEWREEILGLPPPHK